MATSMVTIVGNFFRAVKQNGGVLRSVYSLFVTDDLKWGTHVGTDKFGNKYYENNYYFMARNRWVVYHDKFYLDYNASQIPPEWHLWMHHTTDKPPTEQALSNHRWMIPHEENKTGSNDIYYPYSTTRTKVQSWMPKHLRGGDYEETRPVMLSSQHKQPPAH